MSQGLSSLVPNLSLEDHIYQAEELITATGAGGAGAVLGVGHLPGRGPSPDSHSVRSCESCCMEVEPTERGRLEVCVLPAAFHRSDSYQCSQVSTGIYNCAVGLAYICKRSRPTPCIEGPAVWLSSSTSRSMKMTCRLVC